MQKPFQNVESVSGGVNGWALFLPVKQFLDMPSKLWYSKGCSLEFELDMLLLGPFWDLNSGLDLGLEFCFTEKCQVMS